ncbi:bifunctional folylpolyglutamate synthase/dihydrofolate synthase [Psychrobacter sp. FDAARGOS_221]|uniref:bifunctional folylpolyglutamate synthase/dihydrofolate synthase n=1 Tax=Psychrobacter sp. FDAARGOS_221 TaxID=1975705 RepID=UPI000BB5988E|nr:bifunctional folylpolyglutamate synthase/dihydrofolate synthase [Psychrobacter sp. FDAARGOS_221]
MQQIHVSAIDMGLSRVLPVAEKLGLLQSAKEDAYVFTVAGTNGKGSTTAIISEICQQAGYKTALYQSPHLIDFNERVRIDGQPVGDQRLIDAFYQVEQARLACELTLSFFEMTTLAAMLIFAQAKCDVWVLEVGLGGRLDVVNIINPNLAVITNIGIDHVEWLGDTREKIGYEKAGILRDGIPLVYGEPDMPDSVRQRIEALNCPYYQLQQDYDFTLVDSEMDTDTATESADQSQWQFSSAHVTLQLPKPKLSLLNTANAVAALLASELKINSAHIKQGLQQVKLAGRFDQRQLFERHWLFDVAHNERGVNFLLQQFKPLWQAHLAKYPQAKLHLVFSMLADKDIEQVVELLVQSGLLISQWYIGEIDHPRAAGLQQLSEVLQQHQQSVSSYASVAKAGMAAITETMPDDLILVSGSFHTIGEVLQQLNVSA